MSLKKEYVRDGNRVIGSVTNPVAILVTSGRGHPPMRKRYQREQHKTSAQAPEPRVGIFWLVSGKPVIESNAVSEAEDYGEFKVYPGDHYSVWAELQQGGTVPSVMEYEEAPRGRVMYNTRTAQFTLLADRCILSRKDLVAKIKSELRLPTNIELGTDSHYRCFTCLHRKDDED